jgi:hypothetical protein
MARQKPENRDVAIMLRVTAKERIKFQRHADKMGLKLSSWMRMQLLAAAGVQSGTAKKD